MLSIKSLKELIRTLDDQELSGTKENEDHERVNILPRKRQPADGCNTSVIQQEFDASHEEEFLRAVLVLSSKNQATSKETIAYAFQVLSKYGYNFQDVVQPLMTLEQASLKFAERESNDRPTREQMWTEMCAQMQSYFWEELAVVNKDERLSNYKMCHQIAILNFSGHNFPNYEIEKLYVAVRERAFMEFTEMHHDDISKQKGSSLFPIFTQKVISQLSEDLEIVSQIFKPAKGRMVLRDLQIKYYELLGHELEVSLSGFLIGDSQVIDAECGISRQVYGSPETSRSSGLISDTHSSGDILVLDEDSHKYAQSLCTASADAILQLMRNCYEVEERCNRCNDSLNLKLSLFESEEESATNDSNYI